MKNINKILIAVMVVIIATCIFTCQKAQQSNDDLQSRINVYKQDSTKFVTTINEYGKTINTQQQTEVTQAVALELLKAENSKLKSVIAHVHARSEVSIPPVVIHYKDTDAVQKTDSGNYLQLPQIFAHTDNEWYAISGTIDTNGININRFTTVNEISITIGSESQGWFKKPKPVVTMVNHNPYATTTKMANLVVKNETKWYQNKWLWLGAGAIGGILITR
jgi:hypothetical protein